MYGEIKIKGHGRTIVMVHGTMMDHTMFEEQTAVLHQNYRVITYDQRARTASFGTPYSLTDLADDCLALLDELHIEKCVLVGMSMGGFMATEFIDRYPDRVDALILIGSQIGIYTKKEQSTRMLEFKKFDVDGHVSDALAKETASYIFSVHTHENNKVLVEYWTKRWTTLPARSVLYEAQSWLDKKDYTETAEKFDKPVLVIHGEKDQVLPCQEKTDAMEKAFPKIKIIKIANAGHVVNIEAVQETNKAIRKFLEDLEK